MQLPLDSFVSVPLPYELYGQLAQRYPGGVTSGLEQVVQDFLDRTADDPAAKRGTRQGVQWGSLFMPEGTQIRTRYFGKYPTAEIRRGEIISDAKRYPSMSQLARAMRAGTSNNAWIVLEIKRPTDAGWIRADRIRK